MTLNSTGDAATRRRERGAVRYQPTEGRLRNTNNEDIFTQIQEVFRAVGK